MDFNIWRKLTSVYSLNPEINPDPLKYKLELIDVEAAWNFQQKEINDLTEQNKILMGAVEFYASEDNWDLVCMRPDGEGSAAPIFCDDHTVAREAKRKIEAIEKGE